MLPLALAALLCGSPVLLDIEDARGISSDERAELLRLLQVAVETKTSALGEGGGKVGPKNTGGAATEERIAVRILGVPTRIRLITERIGASSGRRSAEVDLPRSSEEWAPLLEVLVATLYGSFEAPPIEAAGAPARLEPERLEPERLEPERLEPERLIPPVLDGTASRPSKPPLETKNPGDQAAIAWGPIVSGGMGLAAGAVAIGFGLSSRAARAEARSAPHTDAEFDALERRAINHGVAADVLFGVAIVGAVIGSVWLFIDDSSPSP